MSLRSPEEEAESPNYANMERERRWLVASERLPPMTGLPYWIVEDRYLLGTRLRLRKMLDSMSGKVSFKLTKKYEAADPLARPIVTAYLTEDEHRVFAALPGLDLLKFRFKVADGPLAFNVDRFQAPLEGLILTEIEQPDDLSLRNIVPPPWSAREVSLDVAFQGEKLAGLSPAQARELIAILPVRPL